MHFHVGTVDILSTFLGVIIMSFLWRMLAYRLVANDSPWGEAMLVIL